MTHLSNRTGWAFLDKLKAFTAMVEAQSNALHQRRFEGFKPEQVKYSPDGQKYVRVYFDNGTQKSSRYFVEVKTGTIYACEGWKKPNLRRSFGTLDTIDQFDWSEYEGYAKPDSQYKMVKTVAMYASAVLKNFPEGHI